MDFGKIQNFSFASLLLLSTFAFLYILRDYFMPIFWALVLAIVFYPLKTRILKAFPKTRGKEAIASALTILAMLLLLIIPASFLVALFVKELSGFYDEGVDYISGASLQNIQILAEKHLGLAISVSELGEKAVSLLKSYGNDLSAFALGVGKTSADFVLKFAVMLYVLFFFLKDGARWFEKISFVLPLGDKRERHLANSFIKMTRSVFKGSFAIALAQGLAGALIFALAGVQSPVLWGAVMTVLAFIPALGPAIVWVPASLIFFLLGDVKAALIILAGGLLIISMLDNLLRPYLLGKGNKMPDLLIFLSILGALSAFGVVGIVIGPVILAIFLASWEIFENEYKDELQKRG